MNNGYIRNTPLSGRLNSEEPETTPPALDATNTPGSGHQNWGSIRWRIYNWFTPSPKRFLGWLLFWTLYLIGCTFIVWELLVKGL